MGKSIGKIAVFVTVMMFTAALCAQEPPIDDDILRQTVDRESPYYYPALMFRYNAGDTTLTDKDYHYLYYGYALTDDYHPLASISAEDKVLMAFERAHASLSTESMLDVVRYASEVMKYDPFSPSNLNFLIYAYGALGDTLNERINSDRLNKILSVITSSGTGLTEKSPWHILRFSHANDVLGTFGLSVKKRLVVSKTAEYITVTDENGRQAGKGYYFDYSRIYRDMPEDAPQPERRWKINDYPIGGYKKN